MAGMAYCWYCYQPNDHDDGDCDVCGHPVLPPPATPAADIELWALSHPDLDRRIAAVRWLGDHHDTRAVQALRQFVEDPVLGPDLAAAAAQVLTELTVPGPDCGLRSARRG